MWNKLAVVIVLVSVIALLFVMRRIKKAKESRGGENVTLYAKRNLENVKALERLFREHEEQAGAVIVSALQKGQRVGNVFIRANAPEIAQQNNPYGNNPVYGLRTSLAIQLPDGTWQAIGQEPDNPRVPAHTIGDIVEIERKQYRVNFLWSGEGEHGWVSLLPAQGPELDLSSLAPSEQHVRKRNATELFLGEPKEWNGILFALHERLEGFEGNIVISVFITGKGVVNVDHVETSDYREPKGWEERVPHVRYAKFLTKTQINDLIRLLITHNFVAIQVSTNTKQGLYEDIFVEEKSLTVSNAHNESHTLAFSLSHSPPASLTEIFKKLRFSTMQP